MGKVQIQYGSKLGPDLQVLFTPSGLFHSKEPHGRVESSVPYEIKQFVLFRGRNHLSVDLLC